jgi:hypothetical protein
MSLVSSIRRAIKIESRIINSTVGSVLFIGTDGKLQQDNSNLFWDDTNKRLGIGTDAPGAHLEVEDDTDVTAIQVSNSATDGDPILAFALSGTKIFTMGVDDGDGDSFKIGTSAIGTNTRFRIDSDGVMSLPKSSGKGIKIDTTTPTFGWRDITGQIRTRGVGSTDPTDAVYRNGIKGFQFAVNDESWMEFHIPHDYVPGTDIHIHCHWSHNVTTVTGGTTDWSFEIIYAKGHTQSAFPASVTVVAQQTASTTQYMHLINEVQASVSGGSGTQIDTDLIEPDGILLVRSFLSANAMTVSSGPVPDPFCHFADLHYQSTNIATKDKAPNFYT